MRIAQFALKAYKYNEVMLSRAELLDRPNRRTTQSLDVNRECLTGMPDGRNIHVVWLRIS